MPDYKDLNDAEIIEETIQGDAKALDFLLTKYSKSIYNFIFYLTKNKEDSSDILQDTFIKIFRHLKKYKPEYSFKTWAISIARNTTMDWFRKKRAEVFSSFNKDDDEVAFEETLKDPDPLPDEIFEINEIETLLKKAMEILSLDQKTSVILHDYEGFTFEEIGTILKKPSNTVKSHYRRAIEKLKKHLENAPEKPSLS